MNAIEFIKTEMEMAAGWLLPLYEDMQNAPLVQPTPKGGNHTLWNVGHMAYAEANMLHNYIKGNANPLEDWKEQFGGGSTPSTDPSVYPSFETVIEKFKEVHAETLAFLETLTDEDLTKPAPGCPEDYKDYFGTYGQCFAVMTVHFAFHAGQVSDCRRADGRDIMMA